MGCEVEEGGEVCSEGTGDREEAIGESTGRWMRAVSSSGLREGPLAGAMWQGRSGRVRSRLSTGVEAEEAEGR